MHHAIQIGLNQVIFFVVLQRLESFPVKENLGPKKDDKSEEEKGPLSYSGALYGIANEKLSTNPVVVNCSGRPCVAGDAEDESKYFCRQFFSRNKD